MKEISRRVAGSLVDAALFDLITEEIVDALKYFHGFRGEYRIRVQHFTEQDLIERGSVPFDKRDEVIKKLVEALERISGPDGCGCSGYCRCADDPTGSVAKIWKEEVKSLANEALASAKEFLK